MEESFEHKHLRYAELAAQAQHGSWSTKVYPVKVGCRGFVEGGRKETEGGDSEMPELAIEPSEGVVSLSMKGGELLCHPFLTNWSLWSCFNHQQQISGTC